MIHYTWGHQNRKCATRIFLLIRAYYMIYYSSPISPLPISPVAASTGNTINLEGRIWHRK